MNFHLTTSMEKFTLEVSANNQTVKGASVTEWLWAEWKLKPVSRRLRPGKHEESVEWEDRPPTHIQASVEDSGSSFGSRNSNQLTPPTSKAFSLCIAKNDPRKKGKDLGPFVSRVWNLRVVIISDSPSLFREWLDPFELLMLVRCPSHTKTFSPLLLNWMSKFWI